MKVGGEADSDNRGQLQGAGRTRGGVKDQSKEAVDGQKAGSLVRDEQISNDHKEHCQNTHKISLPPKLKNKKKREEISPD